jgi:hypothetical protein
MASSATPPSVAHWASVGFMVRADPSSTGLRTDVGGAARQGWRVARVRVSEPRGASSRAAGCGRRGPVSRAATLRVRRRHPAGGPRPATRSIRPDTAHGAVRRVSCGLRALNLVCRSSNMSRTTSVWRSGPESTVARSVGHSDPRTDYNELRTHRPRRWRCARRSARCNLLQRATPTWPMRSKSMPAPAEPLLYKEP